VSQQGLRQASFRAIHGESGDRPYNADAMLAMKTELEAASITVPDTYNGRLLAWLQLRLDSTNPNLSGLMAGFAAANGADNWSALGSFDPMGVIQDGLEAEYRFDEGEGDVLPDATGNGHDGALGSGDAAPTWGATGLTFDGTNDVVTCDDAGISGATARTLMLFYVPITTGDVGAGWAGGSQVYDFRNTGGGGNIFMRAGGTNDTVALNVSGTTWRTLTLRQTGSNFNTASFQLDGGTPVACDTNAEVNTSGNLKFSEGGGGQFANITMGYALVYSRALTDDEVEQNRDIVREILATRSITLP
jgi:hypothetical protein